MVTGEDIVNAAYELLGAPYRLWQPGMSLPTWIGDNRGDPPPASHLMSVGLECADLVSYALARNGLSYPYQAGTGTFGDFLIDTSDFDPSAPGEPGAVALKPYSGPAWEDQGHAALFVDEHRLIQSIARGVTDTWSDEETYSWGGSTAFEVYGYLPGVAYQNSGGGISAPGEELWRQFGWYEAINAQWDLRWHPPS